MTDYDSDFDLEYLREENLHNLYKPSEKPREIDEELLKYLKKNEEKIKIEEEKLEKKDDSNEFDYYFLIYEYAYLLSSTGLYEESINRFEDVIEKVKKYYLEYELDDEEEKDDDDIEDNENNELDDDNKIKKREEKNEKLKKKIKFYNKNFSNKILNLKENFLLIYYKIIWKYNLLLEFLSNNKEILQKILENDNIIKTEENLVKIILRNYKILTKINSKGIHLGDYAFFLYKKLKNYEKSEKLYMKILQIYPFLTSIRIKYATLMRYYRRNLVKTEEIYKKGIEIDGKNKELLGIYASFLYSVKRNFDDAEKYYKLSIDFSNSSNSFDDTIFNSVVNTSLNSSSNYDSTSTSNTTPALLLYQSISTQPTYNLNNLCNYGLFLSEERKNYVESERLYNKILLMNPNHSNTLYNYSVLLDTCLKNKKKAKLFYNLTLKNDQKHSFALYNYAVLLEEEYFVYNPLSLYDKKNGKLLNDEQITMKNIDDSQKNNETKIKKLNKILNYYKQAYENDPKDTMTMADYGRFLYVSTGNHEKASPYLYTALNKDDMCCTSYIYLSIILFR